MSPPEPTSRADDSNAGDEIERSATSAAALLRFSPAEFPEQADNKNNARTSCKGSRLFCGVTLVSSPAQLTTHEAKTRRGPKIYTKRQLGGAARVLFPAEVPV